jgi:hypothetical protein
VTLDADIAALYGVPTKALTQAVRRNAARFPADFMFRLTRAAVRHLGSQTVTSSGAGGWGGRRNTPYAFTEQGVAMLSSVLRSRRAIEANIAIMRAFVRLHQGLASSESLKRRLDELEKKYDSNFRVVFDAIRELMSPPTDLLRAARMYRVRRAARSGAGDEPERVRRRPRRGSA